MKTQTEITKVQFLYNLKCNDVFAFFPELDYDNFFKTSYSQIGQHSACSIDYAKESVQATSEQSEPLKLELESIGYKLEII